MNIDLKNLFSGSEERVAVNCKLNFADLPYIKDGASVSGEAFSKADVVYLKLNVSFVYDGYCDRCAEPVNQLMQFSIDKILVQSLQNEDDNEETYLIVKNSTLNLDELIEEEIILFTPSKILCSDECKGLCPKCGKNLNTEKCDCKKDIDPRMEALLQLLEEE